MKKQDLLIDLCASEAGTMTIRQLALLAKLRDGKQDFGDLADELGLPLPALTRACDRLEGFGLTCRAVNPRDGRKVYISLTRQGRSFCARYLGRMGSGSQTVKQDSQHDNTVAAAA
jgi:DNA-binding MarR family transcriptional regulator